MVRFYQYNVGVSATFDLNLFPFYRIKGQEWPQLPGLQALVPPRRTARGREDDRLVIYLTFSGNDPLSASEYNQFSDQVTQHFYQTPGSVTSAIRSVAQTINQALVDRNLRTTGKGQYIIGRLILGVLHGSQFVVAQCGPTHVFHLTEKGMRKIHDAQISGRGLGIGQATPLYFTQLDLHSGDQLVLCADLPSGWESALGKHLVSPEALRRELLTVTSDDLNAILVQVQAGKGNLSIQKTLPAPARAATVVERHMAALGQAGMLVPAPVQASIRPTSQVESGRPASRFAQLLAGQGTDAQVDIAKPETLPPSTVTPVTESKPKSRDLPAQTARRPASRSSHAAASPTARSGRFVSLPASGELPQIKRTSARRQGLFRGMAKAIQRLRAAMQKISGSFQRFLPNLFPEPKEGEQVIGGSSLAFFAIAIPVILVTVAGLVYNQYGRTARYQENFNLAFEQANLAQSQSGAADVRHAWEIALHYLDQADLYQVTQESLNLRQQAQTALDNLDGIVRLDFQPAIIGGLDHSDQISRMTATNTDLYLLDASRGSVIRAALGTQGYEVDTNFECGPGLFNGLNVGKLIDIEALQMSNDYNARVMGIDASGTLLYCGFSMTPEAVALTVPPLGWQGISAFTMDTDGKYLYVLDPPGNAVWMYQGTSGKFIDIPNMFFGQQVPQSMSTSIDIAANNSDLYLLFEDGHVTSCPESHYEVVPLRCSDPVTFVDTRPERQSKPLITDAIFNQITFAAAPDPMLYLLEPLTQAVYSFSSRSGSLELRGQFRTSIEQSNKLANIPATAVTISPNRYIFFATSDQVFFAKMP
jgi:hypothetical protein